MAERLGGSDKFHTASLAEVFKAFELDTGGFMELPRIIEDGVVLPSAPMRGAFSSKDTFNAVPTISGTNRDEMKLFYLFDKRLTKTTLGKFIQARDQDFYDAAAEYSSRVWRIRSVDLPLAMMANAGHKDTYAYRFDWDEGGKFLWTDLSKVLGAAHAAEIPFVFNRYKMFGDADSLMFQEKTLATRDTLSRSMGAYWTEFARSGNPANAGGPEWAPYSTDATLMYFDSTNDAGIRSENGSDSISKLVDDLKNDTRITPKQRCEIAEGLRQWGSETNSELSTFKDCTE